MTIDYYRLAYPITRLHIVEAHCKGHSTLCVWINGEYSGELYMPNECLSILINKMVNEETHPILHTYWGGNERGMVVIVRDRSLPDNAQVISSDGRLTTVGRVKRQDMQVKGSEGQIISVC